MTDRRVSRRAVLAGVGAASAGLAGCSSLPPSLRTGSNDGGTVDVDPSALSDLVSKPIADRPDPFPLTPPESMVDRHRERARELLAAVPEEPDIPNGAMAERIADERAGVVSELSEDPRGTWADRLRHSHWVRDEAAAVNGAYRAATGDVSASTIRERRDDVRETLTAFVGEWDYSGPDPATAVVINHRIEELVGTCRDRVVQSWPAFPEAPKDAVFTVGEILAGIERGRAAIGDARRLRDLILDQDDTRRYRAAINDASNRLRRRTHEGVSPVERYLDDDSPPVDRDVEDTPAVVRYDYLRDRLEYTREDVEEAREEGRHATAILESGTVLATADALASAVEAIRADGSSRPTSISGLQSERTATVEALREAWAAPPRVVSVQLTEQTIHEVVRNPRRYGDEEVRDYELDDVVGTWRATADYASAVPDAAETIGAVLDGSPGGGE